MRVRVRVRVRGRGRVTVRVRVRVSGAPPSELRHLPRAHEEDHDPSGARCDVVARVAHAASVHRRVPSLHTQHVAARLLRVRVRVTVRVS